MYDDIVDIYNEIFPLNRAFLAFIPAYLGRPGSKVLDLGCGPGDYVNHLTGSRYHATGIDSSSGMIGHARKHNRGAFFHLSFTDIAEIDGLFDCIYCIGNSLSYLSANSTGPFLKDVDQLLNGSGYFLLQVVNWDRYRHTGSSDFPVKQLMDGRTFHRRYEPKENSTVIFHTKIRKDGKVVNAWSDTLSPKFLDDLRRHVAEAGLTIVNVFGDFERSPFDPFSSPATILVAQKSK